MYQENNKSRFLDIWFINEGTVNSFDYWWVKQEPTAALTVRESPKIKVNLRAEAYKTAKRLLTTEQPPDPDKRDFGGIDYWWEVMEWETFDLWDEYAEAPKEEEIKEMTGVVADSIYNYFLDIIKNVWQ